MKEDQGIFVCLQRAEVTHPQCLSTKSYNVHSRAFPCQVLDLSQQLFSVCRPFSATTDFMTCWYMYLKEQYFFQECEFVITQNLLRRARVLLLPVLTERVNLVVNLVPVILPLCAHSDSLVTIIFIHHLLTRCCKLAIGS